MVRILPLQVRCSSPLPSEEECYHCAGEKYSIILPTYNEVDNLPLCIWLINKYLSEAGIDYEVIVVDDASADGTQDACKQLQTLYDDRIQLRPRAAKLGLGALHITKAS